MMLIVLWFAILMAMAEAQTLPDPKQTPGAINPQITQGNIKKTICSHYWSTKSIRPPASYTNKLKKDQLKAAHAKDQKLADYEEDHLISLELGGHPRAIENLWPEPYAGACGARAKDKIEDKLHGLVCDGKLTLAQAQHAISTDWVAAYNRYVGKLECSK